MLQSLLAYVVVQASLVSLGRSAFDGSFIINGNSVGQGDHPYMASIQKSSSFICGGSLVATNVVLTAAHCVSGSQPYEFLVVLGEHNRYRTEGYEQFFTVTRIIRYPGGSTVDLAVLILNGEALQNFAVRVIRLHDQPPVYKSIITATGWGWSSTNDPYSISPVLQKLDLPVTHSYFCLRDGVNVNSWEFCAGSDQPTYTNVCHGDSGGPAVQKISNSEYIQVGVIVRGIASCPLNKDYAVFVALNSGFRNWIKQQAQLHAITTTTTTARPTTRSRGCFAADSEVETSLGFLPIPQLRPGDLVKAVSADGRIVWSPVLVNLHSDALQLTEFLHVYTANRKTPIKLTAKHLVYRQAKNKKDVSLVFAEKILVGDQLLRSQGSTLQPSNVTQIKKVTSAGIYSPLTTEGTILVNGAAASCYAHVPNQAVCHAAFAPLRWFKLIVQQAGFPVQIDWYPALLEDWLSKPLTFFNLFSI